MLYVDCQLSIKFHFNVKLKQQKTVTKPANAFCHACITLTECLYASHHRIMNITNSN